MCRAWLWGFAFRCSAYGFLQMRDGMQMRIDLHWTSRRFSVEYQIVNHRRTSLYHPAIHHIRKKLTFESIRSIGTWILDRSLIGIVRPKCFYPFRMGWGWGWDDAYKKQFKNLSSFDLRLTSEAKASIILSNIYSLPKSLCPARMNAGEWCVGRRSRYIWVLISEGLGSISINQSCADSLANIK